MKFSSRANSGTLSKPDPKSDKSGISTWNNPAPADPPSDINSLSSAAWTNPSVTPLVNPSLTVMWRKQPTEALLINSHSDNVSLPPENTSHSDGAINSSSSSDNNNIPSSIHTALSAKKHVTASTSILAVHEPQEKKGLTINCLVGFCF